MNRADRTLRERLLAMETVVSQDEARRKRIQVVLQGRLSVPVRVALALLAGIGILFVIDFVHLRSWALPPDEDMSRKVSGSVWLTGFIGALAWTALSAYLAVRGKLGARIKPSLIGAAGAAMVFVYMVIRTFAIEYANLRMQARMELEPPRLVVNFEEQLTIAVFFLLVFGGLYMILRVVYRMERKTQEKLLEMEYRLADLAERLGDRKPE